MTTETHDIEAQELGTRKQQLEREHAELLERLQQNERAPAELHALVKNPATTTQPDDHPDITPLTNGASPTNAAVDEFRDWDWAFAARGSGAFNQYVGKHVAIYHQEVVGVDRDADVAIQQAVDKSGAAERDLAVLYIDDPATGGWLHVR